MASAERGSPTILLRLAEGGMADVFVALDAARNLVVLKRIPAARQVSPGLLESLREEARLAARVSHPNVCRLLATTEDEHGEVTLEMEYLEGVQLRRLASASSDVALIAGLLVQAAAGLDHVHDVTEPDGRPAGIVHRDVNPQNLMVTVSGAVKLLDFGIAKARDTELGTRTGSVKGTPAYLSPEQVRGEAVDRRADVFALGSTAVKLLVGEAPFARENFFATVQAITGAPLPDLREQRPDLPAAIVDVLARALERDRERRYPTAGAFAEALVAALPAGVRPLEAAEIAARIGAQFGLEIADRRRRIEFAIDQIDSEDLPIEAKGQRATTQLLDEETATSVTSREVTVTRRRFAVGRRRIAIAAIIGIAGAAAVAVGVYATRPAERPESGQVAAIARAPEAAPAPAPAIEPAPAPAPASPPPAPSADAPKTPAKPRRPRTPRPPRAANTSTASAATDAPGYLTVGSTPYATIHVDGVTLGVTPLFRKPLAAGRRRLRADCSCGKTREIWVTIEPGVAAPPVKLTW